MRLSGTVGIAPNSINGVAQKPFSVSRSNKWDQSRMISTKRYISIDSDPFSTIQDCRLLGDPPFYLIGVTDRCPFEVMPAWVNAPRRAVVSFPARLSAPWLKRLTALSVAT